MLFVLNSLCIVLKFLVGEKRPSSACLVGSPEHSYALSNPSQTSCLATGLLITYFFNFGYFR